MPKEKTLIPNRQIELMFFRIASDAEVGKYIELAEQGLRHTATAYASNKVYRLFIELVDLAEAIGALPTEADEPLPAPIIIGGGSDDSPREGRPALRVLPGGSQRRRA